MRILQLRPHVWGLVCPTSMAMVLAVCFSASAAPTQVPVEVACGDTIVKDTVLAHDLTNCPDAGLYIGADNITLDLNGHTIDGEGDGFESCEDSCDNGVDNQAGFDGMTVRNGHINEFVDGVAVRDARRSTVEQISTTGLAHGLAFMMNTRDSVVRDNQSVDDGGLAFFGESRNINVVDNTVEDNEFGGIALFSSSHATISRNTVTNTGLAGISLQVGDSGPSHHTRIDHNTVSGGSTAVAMIQGSHHNVVTTNAIDDTEDGILVEEGSHGNVVTRNHVGGTEFAAILFLHGTHDNTVSRNNLIDDGDGILVDGDRNRIVDNTVRNTVGVPDEPDSGFGVIVAGGDANLIQGNSVQTTVAAGIAVLAFEGEIAEGNVIRANRVAHAALSGFLIGDAAHGTDLRNNTATLNGKDGVNVESSATRLTANVARDNHDLGVNAVDGVTDGGGNRASGNGDPRECVGVICKP